MKKTLITMILGFVLISFARADIPPPKGFKRITIDHKIITEKEYPDYVFFTIIGAGKNATLTSVKLDPKTPVIIAGGGRGGIGRLGAFVAVPKDAAKKYDSEKDFFAAIKGGTVEGQLRTKGNLDSFITVKDDDTRKTIVKEYALDKIDAKEGIVLTAKTEDTPQKEAPPQESDAPSTDEITPTAYTPHGGMWVAGFGGSAAIILGGLWLFGAVAATEKLEHHDEPQGLNLAMSVAHATVVPLAPSLRIPGLWFAMGFLGLAILAAALAGAIPIEFSIATVFLFAGPHNWLEVRYALGRLPARVGKLWLFFLLSAMGVVGLTLGFAAIPWLTENVNDSTLVGSVYAAWNTAFLLWVATLIWMRSKTNPRFDGGWVWPLACLLCAGVWLNPIALNIALVYLHPLLALCLLDRELTRSRPEWRRTYRCVVSCVPLLLVVLWWHLHDAPDLPGTDTIRKAIIAHTGAAFLGGISTHFLVAAHVFLEMVHYGVWVLLIPLIGMKSWPWELRAIPAVRRNQNWARGIAFVLFTGLGVVAVLWMCFGLDYATTRSIYFTVAMLHVLAEIPFLLRMV